MTNENQSYPLLRFAELMFKNEDHYLYCKEVLLRIIQEVQNLIHSPEFQNLFLDAYETKRTPKQQVNYLIQNKGKDCKYLEATINYIMQHPQISSLIKEQPLTLSRKIHVDPQLIKSIIYELIVAAIINTLF